MTYAVDMLERAAQAYAGGDLWAMVDHLRAALADPAPRGERWREASERAASAGDAHGALQAAQRFAREVPGDRDGAFLLASALTEAGRADEAVLVLAPHADNGALDSLQAFRFTRMLMFAGRIDEAQARARGLLAARPNSPALWERVAQTKRFTPGDGDIDAMRAVLARWGENQPEWRALIAGALAKAFVDLGDDRAADDMLEIRAAANRSRFAFHADALEAQVRDIELWCARAPEEKPAPDGDLSARAIFVIGPARSGTTLVDQIYSRHPLVRGGGEHRLFWLATRVLRDCSSAEIATYFAGGRGRDPWREIGRRYLALADESFGSGAVFVDKLLSNHFRVRAIRQALPAATILSIERAPMDIAWSCWRAQFDAESAWAGSQEGIAAYIGAYRRIMAAWARRYGDRVAPVSYETLVRDPEPQTARLMALAGLSDHPDTRAPHLSNRPVMTLSFAEVRAPIHTKSIGAAEAFPIATRKLREALERAGLDA